ncbi:unnamed protein product [Durusdinium trenchii]|uniref:BRCT domain-containing protein n=2 Tax=Durusdinium trenchii TaxID=1381693 RepID=A0ABP0Q5P6_9DINO
MLQDGLPKLREDVDSQKSVNSRDVLGVPTWLSMTWPLLCPLVAMCVYGPTIRHSPTMMLTIFVAMALPRNSRLGGRMIKKAMAPPMATETLEGFSNFSKKARWHLQRRRLYVKWAADRVDKELHCAWRSVLPLSPRQEIAQAVGGESRGLLCYHAAASAGFLLPPEVVSCSYLPEPGLRAHCVRLLREQWESEARHLASIPEEGARSAWWGFDIGLEE